MLAKKLSISKMSQKCDEVSGLLRSLSHPGRLMILGHLTQGAKTVTELQELCDLQQSQLSQFLGRMRLEGLVACERRGRFQFYSAADERIVRLLGAIQKIFCE